MDARDTVREAIATAYEAVATEPQAVFSYKPADAVGVFPFVAIESSGVEHTPRTFKSRVLGYETTYFYTVHHFVLFADETQNWTKQDAEKAIDAMALEFFTFVAENNSTADWRSIEFVAPSVIYDDLKLGGEQYIDEQFGIAVKI